jgi:hypothetical protein
MNTIVLPHNQGNDLIREWIRENKVFSISRVGGIEMHVLHDYMNGKQVPLHFQQALSIQAGVYGNCLPEFCEEYIKGIASGDMQIVWEGNTMDHLQEDIFKRYSPDSLRVGFKCVEPFYFDEPWSQELDGKKVLIVHPMSQTINFQYRKREKLWENNKVLPKFELVNFTCVQSIGGVGPHSNWKESLDCMKSEISSLDFDIALLGCGAYGLPLMSHIKENIGKSAIYIGGGLQILFGIKGKRWDGIPDVNRLYNENWRRPFDIEIPERHNLVEGGCYW